MHTQDITVLSISCFCSLHRNDKDIRNYIIFKNLQLEKHFQKFTFSSPKTLWCKCIQKRIKSLFFLLLKTVWSKVVHICRTRPSALIVNEAHFKWLARSTVRMKGWNVEYEAYLGLLGTLLHTDSANIWSPP